MRKTGLLFCVLLLVSLLLPASAVAADEGVERFTAQAAIVQTSPGVPQPILHPTKGMVGLKTTGQVFEGTLTSDWGELDGAAITIYHNSLIRLAAPDEGGNVPFRGLARGTFQITKDGSTVIGSYFARLTGTLTPVAPNVWGVSVTDRGVWRVQSADGDFASLVPGGGKLLAQVSGYLGYEWGTLTISGLHRD
jgi:hypothetical protein